MEYGIVGVLFKRNGKREIDRGDRSQTARTSGNSVVGLKFN